MAKKSIDIEFNFVGNVGTKGSRFSADINKSTEKETTLSMSKKTKDIFETIVGDVFMTSIMALPRIASVLVAGLKWIIPAVVMGLFAVSVADLFKKDESGIVEGDTKEDQESMFKKFSNTVFGISESLFKDLEGDERIVNESETEDKASLEEELMMEGLFSGGEEREDNSFAETQAEMLTSTDTTLTTMQTTFETTCSNMETTLNEFLKPTGGETSSVSNQQSIAKTPFEQLFSSDQSIETTFCPVIDTDPMTVAIEKEGELIDTLKDTHYTQLNTVLDSVVSRLKYVQTLQGEVKALSSELGGLSYSPSSGGSGSYTTSNGSVIYTNPAGQVVGMDDAENQVCVYIDTTNQTSNVLQNNNPFAQAFR